MMAAPKPESTQGENPVSRVFGGMRNSLRGSPSGGSNTSKPKLGSRRKIYLSSPFGFAESGRYALDRLRAELESLDMEVWEPFKECAGLTDSESGRRRIAGIRECDGMFAVVGGDSPDGLVMTEIGYALAFDKRLFLFRDDSRSLREDIPLNMVVCGGMPEDWRSYWYNGVAELGDDNKALARWAGRKK